MHKEVLVLQTELWTLMMRSTVKVREVDKALDSLEAGTMRAHQVYKRCVGGCWKHYGILSEPAVCVRYALGLMGASMNAFIPLLPLHV